MVLQKRTPVLTRSQTVLSLLIFGSIYCFTRNATMGTEWAYDGLERFPLLLFEREGVCLFMGPFTANRFLCALQAGFFCLFPLWAWRGEMRVAKTCLLSLHILLWFTLGRFLAALYAFPPG